MARPPQSQESRPDLTRSPMLARARDILWRASEVALLASLYFLVARIGLLFDPTHGVAALLWPGAAIAFFALFRFGLYLWPGVFIGAAFASLVAQSALEAALGVAAGSTLVTIALVLLFRRFGLLPYLLAERKRYEKKLGERIKELEQAHAALKETERLKTEFVSLASHHLRTPLIGIRWLCESILKKEGLSEHSRKKTQEIERAAANLALFVDKLLDVSRLEMASGYFATAKVELVSFTEDFLDEWKPIADKKNISCRFVCAAKTLEAYTDLAALRSIIQTIVHNALHYTPEGGAITVSLSEKDRAFLFEIRDTGPGIPNEEQPFIFHKFFRGSAAKLANTEGSGLGLYLTFKIVTLMGGAIWFESRQNSGTSFFVELPLERKPPQ